MLDGGKSAKNTNQHYQRLVGIATFTFAERCDRLQASAYGKCIVKDYNHVTKDKCLSEFMQLKRCFVVGVSQYMAYIERF